jgi:hypothetical protein
MIDAKVARGGEIGNRGEKVTMFDRWDVRTVSANAARYDPAAYANGSA